jgi:hypothetical protein
MFAGLKLAVLVRANFPRFTRRLLQRRGDDDDICDHALTIDAERANMRLDAQRCDRARDSLRGIRRVSRALAA